MWTSTDPAGEFFNPYAYTTNPTVFIDPTGESFGESLFLGIAMGMMIAGLNSVYSDDTSFESFVRGQAIGAASGAVGGMIGYGVGEAMSAATSAWSAFASNVVTYSVSGAAAGTHSSFVSAILSTGDLF